MKFAILEDLLVIYRLFYQFFLVKWGGIVSEIWSKNAEKLPKDPRKMRNEFSVV
jgi:hypothetical protein